MSQQKKKKNISPTVLSLRWWRSRGMPSEVVEKFIRFGKFGIRRDCFGGDLLCLSKSETCLVQAGIAAHHAEKIKKASAEQGVKDWLASESRCFFVQTWKKRPAFCKGGERKKMDEWASRLTRLVLVNGQIEPREFTTTSAASPCPTPVPRDA